MHSLLNSLFAMIILFISGHYQESIIQSDMTAAKKIQAVDIEKFVRKNVNHSYNRQLFDEQLNHEIQNNLAKMQQSILKDMKRKMILKNQQQLDIKKRQSLKKQLEEKLSISQSKREAQILQRKKLKSDENKYKESLIQDRLSLMKKQEKKKAEQQLKQIESKSKIGGPVYNKISRSVSLIEEPHYRKKLLFDEQQYRKLKDIVQEKSAFKGPRIQRRQLSLTDVRPREGVYIKLEQQRVNKLGEHLDRIQETRKKRQNLISQKVKSNKQIQKYILDQRNERMKIIIDAQKHRQQTIAAKLSKSALPSSNVFHKSQTNPSRLNQNEQNNESPVKQSRGSIIYQQSEDREKHTYRKEIKQKIRDYMLKQKQRILNS